MTLWCLACKYAHQQRALYSVSPGHQAHHHAGNPILLQATGTWAQICALKTVVSEPRGTGDNFDSCMAEYYAAIKSGRGGLMMAVCRGKVGLFTAGRSLQDVVVRHCLVLRRGAGDDGAVIAIAGREPGCLCKAQHVGVPRGVLAAAPAFYGCSHTAFRRCISLRSLPACSLQNDPLCLTGLRGPGLHRRQCTSSAAGWHSLSQCEGEALCAIRLSAGTLSWLCLDEPGSVMPGTCAALRCINHRWYLVNCGCPIHV